MSNGYNDSKEDTGQGYNKSYYGRMLADPYEDTIWSFSFWGLPVGRTTGEIAGLAGISEMDPVTWNDSLDDPDKSLSVPLLPATALGCHGLMSVSSSVVNTASGQIGDVEKSSYSPTNLGSPVIATPIVEGEGLYADLLPDSEALAFTHDYSRMCMGTLGALLPRSGFSQVTNGYQASQIAAWRIASLTYDHFSAPFGTHVGGVRPGDKWQILWPPVYPTSSMCFTPGAPSYATPPLNIKNSAVYGHQSPVPLFMDSLVVMVWRPKISGCYEPWDKPLLEGEIHGVYLKDVAACSVINATDGYPSL